MLDKIFYKVFLKHPKSRGVSYGKHFIHSMTLSLHFGIGFVESFLHAIFPILFEKSSSENIGKLTEILHRF